MTVIEITALQNVQENSPSRQYKTEVELSYTTVCTDLYRSFPNDK